MAHLYTTTDKPLWYRALLPRAFAPIGAKCGAKCAPLKPKTQRPNHKYNPTNANSQAAQNHNQDPTPKAMETQHDKHKKR